MPATSSAGLCAASPCSSQSHTASPSLVPRLAATHSLASRLCGALHSHASEPTLLTHRAALAVRHGWAATVRVVAVVVVCQGSPSTVWPSLWSSAHTRSSRLLLLPFEFTFHARPRCSGGAKPRSPPVSSQLISYEHIVVVGFVGHLHRHWQGTFVVCPTAVVSRSPATPQKTRPRPPLPPSPALLRGFEAKRTKQRHLTHLRTRQEEGIKFRADKQILKKKKKQTNHKQQELKKNL